MNGGVNEILGGQKLNWRIGLLLRSSITMKTIRLTLLLTLLVTLGMADRGCC